MFISSICSQYLTPKCCHHGAVDKNNTDFSSSIGKIQRFINNGPVFRNNINNNSNDKINLYNNTRNNEARG